ncbi:MAG: hypothetical protein QXE85_00885, partial [Nitrososphaerota archaeon]
MSKYERRDHLLAELGVKDFRGMPANLPAEAERALAKYQVARTIEEKIRALEEALSLIPDHKGTEKLRG